MNRHPHAEMMMQYALNRNLIVEYLHQKKYEWLKTNAPCWEYEVEYRFKPGQEIPLKIGEKCLFWNTDRSNALIGTLEGYSTSGYISRYHGTWDNCKPIPKTKTYVKKAWEIVKWLEENDYKAQKNGDWEREGFHPFFIVDMFQYCGKEKPNKWGWLPEWLEEREV